MTAAEPIAHDIRPGVVRCDACGQRVYMVAERGDKMLCFCMHHGNKHLLALEADGWTVFDYSDDAK